MDCIGGSGPAPGDILYSGLPSHRLQFHVSARGAFAPENPRGELTGLLIKNHATDLFDASSLDFDSGDDLECR